ncbi:MAG: ThiF family adenylyltransferase [Thermodesulfobacteriota bacterium]
MLENRYAKQVLFQGIGPEGQDKILRSTAAVIGVGALGTVIATHLCRAGVGNLRLIDRDFVERSNLQRQFLFDEQDAVERIPKAVAAAGKLRAVNSEITIEPVIADVTARNVEQLTRGADVIMDGTDNLETRFLINDAALKSGKPWVYGGAVGSHGMTMTIIPGQTPCLRCMMPEVPPPGSMPNCDTEGVLSAVTAAVASLQSAEALKVLTGKEPRRSLFMIDVWEGRFNEFTIYKRPECRACGKGDYEYLGGARTSWTTVLCGRNAVQIVPPQERQIPLKEVQGRLARVGRTSFNGFLLAFEAEGRELTLFPTGRAIIRGTTDEAEARTFYAKYIGL